MYLFRYSKFEYVMEQIDFCVGDLALCISHRDTVHT